MLYHKQNKSPVYKQGELLEKPKCDSEEYFQVTLKGPLKHTGFVCLFACFNI